MKISQSDLTHHRLQAMLREHRFHDLEYLGKRESFKSGKLSIIVIFVSKNSVENTLLLIILELYI